MQVTEAEFKEWLMLPVTKRFMKRIEWAMSGISIKVIEDLSDSETSIDSVRFDSGKYWAMNELRNVEYEDLREEE